MPKARQKIISGSLLGLALLFAIGQANITVVNAAGYQDPAYVYTKTFGAVEDDAVNAIATDSRGNAYATGYFYEGGPGDFDPGAGVDEHEAAYYDIFLTKTNADGSYGYTKIFGGIGDDIGTSIAVDSNDNIYIAGYFNDTVDFDPGVGVDEHVSAGSDDIFLTKMNSDGSYGYTKTFGDTNGDGAYAIAIDGANNIYLTGYFNGTVDFDPGVGVDEHSVAGVSNNAFLTKIKSDGSYGYTKTLAGQASTGKGITLDDNNNLYVVGNFSGSIDLDPGDGVDQYAATNMNSIFLIKFNATGNYVYGKVFDAQNNATPNDVAIDAANNIYLAGYFNGTVDFDPGTGVDNYASVDNSSGFLTKINADGSYGSTRTYYDYVEELAIDSLSNIYAIGSYTGTADFDPGAGADEHVSIAGSDDIYLTKINADGSYGYTKSIGGNDWDKGFALNIDTSDNIYIGGAFTGTVDFDPGTGVDEHTEYDPNASAYGDAYLTKFSTAADQDGISSAIENAAPNGGDANGDGTADSEQSNVASLPNSQAPDDGAYVTLAVDAGDCDTITSFNSVSEASQASDDNYNYPIGLADFSLTCDTPGSTAEVTIYYDKVYDTSAWSVRKVIGDSYSNVTGGASFGTATVGSSSVTTLSYQLTDGGELDADGASNGTIVDPVGPAVSASATTGGDSNSGGSTVGAPNTGLPAANLLLMDGAGMAGVVLVGYAARRYRTASRG